MPSYDYSCSEGHVFTEWQQMSAPKLEACPDHPGAKVERLIGAGGGIIFKGSGFYCNDYPSRLESKTREGFR